MKKQVAAFAGKAGFKILCALGFIAVAVPAADLVMRLPATATEQRDVPTLIAEAPAPIRPVEVADSGPSEAAVAAPAKVVAQPVKIATASPPKLPYAPLPKAEPAAADDDSLVIKRVLNVPSPFRHGDFVWDDEGVPPGRIIITADIAAQTISVFRGGYEIGTAVILYGADDMPTPTGVFPITQKSKNHVSNLYGVPMPYMMRLTNDGVAIHASDVDLDSATRGCIGVPKEFARRLFEQVKLGDTVIVTNGEALDVGGRITAIR